MNQSRHDGVDLDFAAFCRAAAGLVVNECSGWSGWGGRSGGDGTRSAGVSDLLVRERSGDGVSWSPPGRALQADTTRKLMVVEDVLLKSTFPQLLPPWADRAISHACLVANSDQQTGRWRPARLQARRMPSTDEKQRHLMCLDSSHEARPGRAAPTTARKRWDTSTTDSRVASQSTVQSASWKPFPTNRRVACRCSASHPSSILEIHRSAWWESAGSASLIFIRIPIISPPLVRIPIT